MSVVVPIYGVEQFLGDCLESILGQSYKRLQILLIDDGSPDRSGDIADDFARRDARVTVEHQSNQGVSAARNRGLDLAFGQYVCFVDADDLLAPVFVEEMLGLAMSHQAEMVISTSTLARPDEVPRVPFLGRDVSANFATAELLYPRIIIGSWNKLFSTDFLRRQRLRFSTELFSGEGQLFVTTAASMSRKTVMTDSTGYYYRFQRPGSAVTAQTSDKWNNGLDSIDAIRRSLQSDSREVLMALDFHEWETALCATVFSESTLAPDEVLRERCAEVMARVGMQVALRGRLSFRYRLAILVGKRSPSLALSIRRGTIRGLLRRLCLE